MNIYSSKLAVTLTVITIGALSSLTAYADSNKNKKNKLVGVWGFTTDQTCSRSTAQPPGTISIDPDTKEFHTDVHIVDMTGFGEIIFEPDGRFFLTAGGASEMDKHDLMPGAIPVTSGFIPICEGDWEMVDKNQYIVDWNCTIDVPTQGIQIQAGPVLVDGFVSLKGKSSTMNLRQNIQTLTATVNGVPVGERQRICIQRFSLIKTGKI